MIRSRLLLSCVFACALLPGLACAQQADAKQSRERELLRRQAEQMRQLEAERATLQQEQAKVAGEKEALARDLQAAQKKVVALDGALRNKLHQLEQDLETARAEQALLREQLAAAERSGTEYRQAAEALQARLDEAGAQSKQLTAMLQERERQIEKCSGHNRQLVDTGREILERLSDGSCAKSSDFRWDPVVQTGRIRFENTIEAYRDKLADQRYLRSAAQ